MMYWMIYMFLAVIEFILFFISLTNIFMLEKEPRMFMAFIVVAIGLVLALTSFSIEGFV